MNPIGPARGQPHGERRDAPANEASGRDGEFARVLATHDAGDAALPSQAPPQHEAATPIEAPQADTAATRGASDATETMMATPPLPAVARANQPQPHAHAQAEPPDPRWPQAVQDAWADDDLDDDVPAVAGEPPRERDAALQGTASEFATAAIDPPPPPAQDAPNPAPERAAAGAPSTPPDAVPPASTVAAAAAHTPAAASPSAAAADAAPTRTRWQPIAKPDASPVPLRFDARRTHASATVDPPHASATVDPPHASATVDPAHASATVDPTHAPATPPSAAATVPDPQASPPRDAAAVPEPSASPANPATATAAPSPSPSEAPPTAASSPEAPAIDPQAMPAAPEPTRAPTPAAARSEAPSSHEPVTLARAEDLATAIDRLRPIPRGGATIALQAPGVGTLALTVRIEDGVVHVRIATEDAAAAAWLREEQVGLRAVAQQAVPQAHHVELELPGAHAESSRGDATAHGDRDARREAATSLPPQSSSQPGPARGPGDETPAPTPAARARGLVDVVA